MITFVLIAIGTSAIIALALACLVCVLASNIDPEDILSDDNA